MGQEKQYKFTMMKKEDIEGVFEVEKDVFKNSWSKETFQGELDNPLANYIILNYDNEICGYAGFWLVLGEAHITNIAIKKKLQGKGLGRELVQKLIQTASDNKAEVLYLEARESNKIAQNLYKSFGFETIGLRRGYYVDNNEDAILMKKDL